MDSYFVYIFFSRAFKDSIPSLLTLLTRSGPFIIIELKEMVIIIQSPRNKNPSLQGYYLIVRGESQELFSFWVWMNFVHQFLSSPLFKSFVTSEVNISVFPWSVFKIEVIAIHFPQFFGSVWNTTKLIRNGGAMQMWFIL